MATVEINDAVFCQAHLKEIVSELRALLSLVQSSNSFSQCDECEVDLREENDAFYGVCILSCFLFPVITDRLDLT
jgi:hypothetical protein